jgi:hypothetical protein
MFPYAGYAAPVESLNPFSGEPVLAFHFQQFDRIFQKETFSRNHPKFDELPMDFRIDSLNRFR